MFAINNKFLKILLAVASVVILFFIYNSTSSINSFIQNSDKLVKIHVYRVNNEKLINHVSANGSSAPSTVVKVSLPVVREISSQRINAINVNVGDSVNKGDILAKLENQYLVEDISKIKKALAELRRSIDLLNNNLPPKKEYFNTMEDLFNKGYANRNELESARNSLNQIEIAILEKKRQLNDNKAILRKLNSSLKELKIVSPIEGVVIEKYIEEGEFLTQNSRELFSIGDITNLNLIAKISQEDLNNIYINQEVEVSFNYFAGKSYRGKVVSIDPTVDEETQTLDVVVQINNKDRKLSPGLTAFLKFKTEKEVVVVPKLSVIGVPGKNYVFLLDESKNKVILKNVITGASYLDGKVEILQGLKLGEKIAISNLERLQDGISVKVLTD